MNTAKLIRNLLLVADEYGFVPEASEREEQLFVREFSISKVTNVRGVTFFCVLKGSLHYMIQLMLFADTPHVQYNLSLSSVDLANKCEDLLISLDEDVVKMRMGDYK